MMTTDNDAKASLWRTSVNDRLAILWQRLLAVRDEASGSARRARQVAVLLASFQQQQPPQWVRSDTLIPRPRLSTKPGQAHAAMCQLRDSGSAT